MPFPIPNDPGLRGAELTFQWAILDPVGGYQGFAAASEGLMLSVGDC